MKKINIIIIIPILLLLTTGCFHQKEEQVTNPLLYKITNTKTDTTIYLLGSIHAADDTAYPINKKVMDAFNDSDYLAVEVDINALNNNYKLQLDLAQKMLYSDGTTINQHIPEELYNSMVSLLKDKNVYNSLYDNYKPIFFESLLENEVIKDASLDSNKGIDMHFLNLAKEQNKDILEVETAEFQYNLLLNVPDELESILLQDYIDNYDANVEELKKIYESWKKGDAKEIKSLLTEEDDYSNYTIEEQKMLEDYNNNLIYDRNYNMAKTLEKYMSEEKNVFCVVGLAHVISENGIVDLLTNKGYIVEEVK